jgi:hypothetical protein
MHDRGDAEALVEVDPAQKGERGRAVYVERADAAPVPDGARRGEAGEPGKVDLGSRPSERVGGGRPARAENEGDLMLVDSRAPADLGCGVLGGANRSPPLRVS